MAARLLVQGTTPAAVRYGVISHLAAADPRFRLHGKTGRKLRKALRLHHQAEQVTAFGLRWARENKELLLNKSHTTTELVGIALASPDAPAIGGPIVALLLGVVGRWLAKLVLTLLFEWLMSAESELYREHAWCEQ